MLILLGIVAVIVAILCVEPFLLYKTYKRNQIEDAYLAWIPVANVWKFFKVTGVPMYLLLVEMLLSFGCLMIGKGMMQDMITMILSAIIIFVRINFARCISDYEDKKLLYLILACVAPWILYGMTAFSENIYLVNPNRKNYF